MLPEKKSAEMLKNMRPLGDCFNNSFTISLIVRHFSFLKELAIAKFFPERSLRLNNYYKIWRKSRTTAPWITSFWVSLPMLPTSSLWDLLSHSLEPFIATCFVLAAISNTDMERSHGLSLLAPPVGSELDSRSNWQKKASTSSSSVDQETSWRLRRENSLRSSKILRSKYEWLIWAQPG